MLVSGINLGINGPIEYITRDQNERIRAEAASRYGLNNTKITERVQESYGTRIGGIICERGQEQNPARILLFQFNPPVINDKKSNNYNVKSHSGFTFNDNIWANGGPRDISFRLFFDATAAVNTPIFGRNVAYGDPQVDTLASVYPRGTLDYTELLQSFQYPQLEDPNAPRFSNGGHIPTPKFLPPPMLIFAYGNYYLQGVVSEVDITHTLQNKDLIPVRSEANIVFTVAEQTLVKYRAIAANAAPSPVNDNQGDLNGAPNVDLNFQ